MNKENKKYLVYLAILTVLLFFIVANIFKTSIPATDFFLSLIASHFIVDRLYR